MFKSKSEQNSNYEIFKPPKITMRWVPGVFIGIFIIPVLVMAIPYFNRKIDISFLVLTIIALSLLSLQLLILCFSFILRLYNESYSRQVAEFKLTQAEKNSGIDSIFNNNTKEPIISELNLAKDNHTEESVINN